MKNIIYDWFDLILIAGLSFNSIIIGTYLLPQLPEKVHFYFALGVLFTTVYFTRRMVDFIMDKFSQNCSNKK